MMADMPEVFRQLLADHTPDRMGRVGKPGRPLWFAPHASQGLVTSVAFSPDSTRVVLAGDSDHCLHVWEVATGKQLLTLSGHQRQIPAAR